MSLQAERLSTLIEFCHHSARLKGNPAASVSGHANFCLFEHELVDIPGVKLNSTDPDGGDEIWLSVDRLHERKPPEVTSEWLKPWILFAKGASDEPTLKQFVEGRALIEVGTHAEDDDSGLPVTTHDKVIVLVDYEENHKVAALHEEYIKNKWIPWATEERKRLKAIRLYAHLFTLKQQLEGGMIEAPLELVWGVGFGIWKTPVTTVSYPLISQLVELALNPVTAALEVRPRESNPRAELDWYAAQDNHGVSDLEKSSKEFFTETHNVLSPFDRSTFEPLLQTAVTLLDANGVYWPTRTQESDRNLPKADEQLKITDTWVLFARPRSNNAYLHDLERLKAAAEELDIFPPAVEALVDDPDQQNQEITLPAFRGISASYRSDGADATFSLPPHKEKDLFFPKPFNDEQVRIIQLLEVFDGVVVQGPPGTGKTHTIANVICHYLANGKRVLVTSMKDHALGVLTNQLPDEIKPLAISLLTNEQDGLKKFEHSILKIASEVQDIDRAASASAISHLEESIDAMHGQLASIDWEVANWAKKNLSSITIDSVKIDPSDAAKELVSNLGEFEWIPDQLNITDQFSPKFNDQDVRNLRSARSELGGDLVYLDAALPQLVEFPDSRAILETHQDLSQLEQLKQAIVQGKVTSLRDNTQSTLDKVATLKADLDAIQIKIASLDATGFAWIPQVKSQLTEPSKVDFQKILSALGKELKTANEERNAFFTRPVVLPNDFETNAELADAVDNLAEGKRPFGITGVIGKSAEKRALDSIQILGNAARSPEDWRHVKEYLQLQKRLRKLAIRWNSIAEELKLPAVPVSAKGGLEAFKCNAICDDITQQIALEDAALKLTIDLFPDWPEAKNSLSDAATCEHLKQVIRHHLTKNRLETVLARKEAIQKILDGRSGPIVECIREFINRKLGNPSVPDSEIQDDWSTLSADLSRVLGLSKNLEIVKSVTQLIEESGAPEFSALLRKPAENASLDSLLPDNWRQSWKLKRLDTYLSEVDAQAKLKQLSKQRSGIEADLSKAYKDVVVRRTWLKLAENASPSIRAALQAYLSAIQKIGKGTGKRAVRYRQDARNAASLANSAVPCWIMPHYRISESLPPEIGCFDLVIIDEASQSDLTALPALLRAKKALIVGDDKQVSPEGVGLEEEKIRSLMTRFLGNQVETYRPQMSPDRSIYDLFKVVYATSSVMLKEHFRCVGPIIEFSKREFYNHELRPLRLPKSSERLDPPLIDVLVQDGYRDADKNMAEARFIVEEIKRIASNENYATKSIGVVSLLGDKQAYLIWEMLTEELGPEYLQRHDIACGDARTFQGKERDIIFLSMIVAPNEKRIMPLARDTYAQRFNVAASRARDRMYLVRSATLDHLSDADKLRRSLINHFSAPFAQDEARQENLRALCESPFEREVYDALTERGYWVTPQVKVGQFRIDMVVEGNNDARLAIECDGDRYHGPEKWADDMHRQRILERAGWTFWRCFASTWVRRKNEMIEDLLKTLSEHSIEPVGLNSSPRSIHTEQRIVSTRDLRPVEFSKPDSYSAIIEPINGSSNEETSETVETTVDETDRSRSLEEGRTDKAGSEIAESLIEVSNSLAKRSPSHQIATSPSPLRWQGIEIQQYVEFSDQLTGDPREVNVDWISKNLIKIVAVEGPVVAKRACDIYLRSVGVKRMGHEIRATMLSALRIALKAGEIESIDELATGDLMSHILRPHGSEPLVIRTRGGRPFEEIVPSEIQFIGKFLTQKKYMTYGSDAHMRAILDFFELKRLTSQTESSILDILKRKLPHVDAALE